MHVLRGARKSVNFFKFFEFFLIFLLICSGRFDTLKSIFISSNEVPYGCTARIFAVPVRKEELEERIECFIFFYWLPLPADALCSKLKRLSVRTSDKRNLFLDRD